MDKRWRLVILLMVAMAAGSWSAHAQTFITLGEQDFLDGEKLVGIGAFNSASVGEPAPFDQFYGGDVDGPNFSASWTFDFAPSTHILAAAITMGLFDHDSAASGPQVAFFGVNGSDLTSALNTALDAHGGANGEYNVYTVTLPAEALDRLFDGSAVFTLRLTAPGLGALGNTAGNGAGLDFSTLSLAVVPEPATAALFSLGLGGWWLVALRRRKGAVSGCGD